MTPSSLSTISTVRYHRIYADTQGGSHFATNIIEQSSVQAAPPAAPFYVSGDHPATKYRFYTFEPGRMPFADPAGSSSLSCREPWRWRRPMAR